MTRASGEDIRRDALRRPPDEALGVRLVGIDVPFGQIVRHVAKVVVAIIIVLLPIYLLLVVLLIG